VVRAQGRLAAPAAARLGGDLVGTTDHEDDQDDQDNQDDDHPSADSRHTPRACGPW
jgi:hypothetical protein